MGTLTFSILSILCAVLQQEVIASSSDGASSSNSLTASSSGSSSRTSSTPSISPRRQTNYNGRIGPAYVFMGQPSPSYIQSVYEVHTENPTHVVLTKDGDIIGPGFAIHSYFTVSRREFFRVGFEVSTHEGKKLKPHEVYKIDTYGTLLLIETKRPLLLGNGHSEPGALSNNGYTPEEIKYADDYVKKDIKKSFPPESRPWRGDED